MTEYSRWNDDKISSDTKLKYIDKAKPWNIIWFIGTC